MKKKTMADILKEAQLCLDTEAKHRQNIQSQKNKEQMLKKSIENSKKQEDYIYPIQEEKIIFPNKDM